MTDVPTFNSERTSFPSQKQPEHETAAGIQQLSSLLRAEKTKSENCLCLTEGRILKEVQTNIKKISHDMKASKRREFRNFE